MDQRRRQLELGAQSKLTFGHLSIVGFMVIAGKMQHAMQHQHLKFIQSLVPVGGGILFCEVGGNGYVAASSPRRWKREHVSRFVLLAKPEVQGAQLEVTGDQDRYFTAHARKLLCTPGKARERRLVRRLYRFLENDHARENKLGGPLPPSHIRFYPFLLLERRFFRRLLARLPRPFPPHLLRPPLFLPGANDPPHHMRGPYAPFCEELAR